MVSALRATEPRRNPGCRHSTRAAALDANRVYLPDEILLEEPSVTRRRLDVYERVGNAVGIVEAMRRGIRDASSHTPPGAATSRLASTARRSRTK